MRTGIVCTIALFVVAAAPAIADPRPEKPRITVGGQATNASPGGFTLDYGDDTVRVETLDWPWYRKKGHGLIDGNKVRVHGVPDTDFAGRVRIEANALYIPALGTRFHHGEAGQRDFDTAPTVTPGRATVHGIVTDISGTDLTLGLGPDTVTVDTALLTTRLLDQPGDPAIEEGARIQVGGKMQGDAAESLSLKAETLIQLKEDAP